MDGEIRPSSYRNPDSSHPWEAHQGARGTAGRWQCFKASWIKEILKTSEWNPRKQDAVLPSTDSQEWKRHPCVSTQVCSTGCAVALDDWGPLRSVLSSPLPRPTVRAVPVLLTPSPHLQPPKSEDSRSGRWVEQDTSTPKPMFKCIIRRSAKKGFFPGGCLHVFSVWLIANPVGTSENSPERLCLHWGLFSPYQASCDLKNLLISLWRSAGHELHKGIVPPTLHQWEGPELALYVWGIWPLTWECKGDMSSDWLHQWSYCKVLTWQLAFHS